MTIVFNSPARADSSALPGALTTVTLGGDLGDGKGWQPITGWLTANSSQLVSSASQRADADGYLEFELAPNSAITPAETTYRWMGPDGRELYIQVPESTEKQWVKDLLTVEPPQVQGSVAGAGLVVTDAGNGLVELTPIGLVTISDAGNGLTAITIGG